MDKLAQRLEELGNGWQLKITDHQYLEKTYRFNNFAQGLEFVNGVGALADAQAHHPDVYLAWGCVTLRIWTHKVNGLTESDFVLAKKCDAIL